MITMKRDKATKDKAPGASAAGRSRGSTPSSAFQILLEALEQDLLVA
jgi:hypothetical protein